MNGYATNLTQLARGHSGCEVSKLVWLVEYVRGGLVDQEVGIMVVKEGVQMRDVLEDGHKRADALGRLWSREE